MGPLDGATLSVARDKLGDPAEIVTPYGGEYIRYRLVGDWRNPRKAKARAELVRPEPV